MVECTYPKCDCTIPFPEPGQPLQECPKNAEPAPAFYCVCPFLVDLVFGGPEEGGWYYHCGEPAIGEDLPIPRITKDESEARLWRREMQATLDATVNVGRCPISSVLSTGRYSAEICDGWPKAYPETTPHYE